MSTGYVAVGWSPGKKRYDAVIAAAVVLYLVVFSGVSLALRPEITAETLLIRAFGSLALTLLHVVLAIGPLARLDARFLPLLWNRRHLGVTMFLCGLAHGGLALFQFHFLGDRNPLVSLLTSNTQWGSLAEFPFQQLGAAALVILFLMAATSHDFWLVNLSAPVWKRLHMAVYFAYALLVGHVALGTLQDETSPLALGAFAAGMMALIALHVAAAFKGRALDREIDALGADGFVEACRVGDIRDKRAKIVTLAGERVAIFRYDGKLSAVSNVCQHQNGPLGEGRILDGCITCPWHGFQYRPADGASPAPFTERVPTFRLRLVDGDRVFVDPRPLAAGTFVEPVAFEEKDLFEGKKDSVKSGEERAAVAGVESPLSPARISDDRAAIAGVGPLRSPARISDDRAAVAGVAPKQAPQKLDEFFVAYLPVPAALARFARGVAAAVLVGCVAIAAAVASGQKPLGQGKFEYDKSTKFEGQLVTGPVAGILQRSASAAPGTSSTESFLPLVGAGKHGPSRELLAAGDRPVALEGHLIERYGKRLVEVVKEDPVAASALSRPMAPAIQISLGRQTLRGEIVDSKCWFGVMKPGQGKAHRDCAVRCISGGAPPAFVVRSIDPAGAAGTERTTILLLVGVSGESIASRILDLVAEPVEIFGDVSRLGDQLLISTDPSTIRRIHG
ncbi:MAG: Rieske 2Fe-2S domain-containing protein [Thermoanaerobaculia bacterium]